MSSTENLESQSSSDSSSQSKTSGVKIPSKIKNLTFVLATLGVIPLFVCSIGFATHVNESQLLLKILLAYTAFLISFLCGLHWGVAICQDVKFPKLSRTLIIEGILLTFGSLGVYLFVNTVWLQISIFSGMLILIWFFELIIGIKKLIPLWAVGLRTLITVLTVGLLALVFLQEMPNHAVQVKKQTVLKPVASQIATIPKK